MRKLSLALTMMVMLQSSFAQTVFLETFDGVGGSTAGGPGTFAFPNGWLLVNVDNLTPNTQVAYVNEAWERREDFANNVADSAAFSTSWYTPEAQADDWMWTPTITVPANGQLKWNAVTYDAQYPDGYEVRIMVAPDSPTGSAGNLGNMVSASTQLFTIAAENTTWTPRSVSLAAYAGQSVRIAFRNRTNNMFLLLIDDVEVSAVINNNVSLTTVNPLSEYTLTPLSQVPAAGYAVSALVTNSGLNTATQVSLEATVYNAANAIVASGNSGSTGIVVGGTATLTATNFLPTAPGDYMVVYNLTMNPADQAQADNVDTQYISITASTYARDNGIVTGSLGIGAGNGGFLGQDFILNTSADLHYIQGFFTRGYTGKRLAAVVWSMPAGVPSTIVAVTDTITYPDDSARLYQLPIKGGIANLAAGRYAFTFIEFDSTLALGQTNEIFTLTRGWVNWPTIPGGTWSNPETFGATFERAYVIRPIFCQSIVPGFNIVSPVCQATNGSASVSVTGGDLPYQYAWSNGSSGNSVSGLAAGSYSLTVTDALGCSASATAAVAASNVTLSVSTTPVAAVCTTGGSATASVTNGTAGFTYLWSNGSTDAAPINLTAGSYTVTATDANGCTGTASTTVTLNSLTLSATTSTTTSSCTAASGSATATITNGTAPYSYNWNGGGNTQTVSGLGAGNYTVTFTDANGCTGTAAATVTTPNGPSASATASDVLCAGGQTGAVDLSVSGGTAPITYIWSNGSNTEDLSGVAAGSYSVTVADGNGCSFVTSGNVAEPAALSFTGTVTDASSSTAADGSITLNISGGKPGYTTSPSSLTNLAPGNYSVTVTDNNGCTATQSFTVGFSSGVQAVAALGSVRVYPNPASSELMVDLSLQQAADVQISLYTVTGAMVYQRHFNNQLTQLLSIPVGELPQGVYNLQITSAGETKNAKVVVQH
ncbi:MAG: choice-of-anchor J domain-containing protein [Bacteroidetes bacterium]|nr:choice-of-anchor J domain-containing protein [Bacteroidota bacterium]